MEDFVTDYMPGAVEKVLETSEADGINLFGQSQGGTLCAMYASLYPEGPLKNLILLSAPTEFAPRTPGPLGFWTLSSRNGGVLFDPAVVPRFFGNLPTDLASALINSAAFLQANAFGAAVRPFGFGAYGAVLREIRDWVERDVSLRSWLAVSKYPTKIAPPSGCLLARLDRPNGGIYRRRRGGVPGFCLRASS